MDARFEELTMELHHCIAGELSLYGAKEVERLLKEMNTIILRQMPRARCGYIRDIVQAIESGTEMIILSAEEERLIKEERVNRAMTGMPL